MNVIIPVTVTDSAFTYSNISEPDTGEAFWLAATSYTLGQEVIRPNHKKYKNILAGTDAGLPEITPASWVESGVSNKWAALDNYRNTQSMAANVLTMKFMLSELIDSIGLAGLEGTDFNIIVNYGGSPIYNFTQSLYSRNAINWYDWVFKKFRKLTSAVRLDIPIVANAEVVITVNNLNGIAKCGVVVVGRKQYIGEIQYSSSGDSLNFSTFERAFDGTVSVLVPRKGKPTVNAILSVENYYLDDLLFVKRALDGVPTIWSGINDENISNHFELFLINGISRRFEIIADYPNDGKITLQLEEF